MNLYKLTLIKENYKGQKWDVNWGFVIAAETAQEARKIANGDLPEFYDEYSGSEQEHDLETTTASFMMKEVKSPKGANAMAIL